MPDQSQFWSIFVLFHEKMKISLIEGTVLVQHVYDGDWPDQEDAGLAGGVRGDGDGLDVVKHLALLSHTASFKKCSFYSFTQGNAATNESNNKVKRERKSFRENCFYKSIVFLASKSLLSRVYSYMYR